MIYSYEAKDGGGRTITGSLEAPDERTAARQVRDLGYFLMRLAPPVHQSGAPTQAHGAARGADATGAVMPGALSRALHSLWSGVGLKDLALFYRQFAAMIHAGVPLYQCLTTLRAQTGSPALRGCIGALSRRVQAGGSLSVAMGEFPWVFTDFHRAMVVAGEATGRLDLMFARLADALEQELALRATIIRETFYPGLVFLLSFLINPAAMVALVVHSDGHAYFVLALLPLLEFLAGALLFFVLLRLATQLKVAFDALLYLIPGIGGAVRMVAMARFARSLSLLYAAGLSVPDSVKIAAAACGNAYLERKMLRAIPALQRGEGITEALVATGAFPPMVVIMLRVGEQTGDLDQSMTKVAEYYEQEAAVRLHQLSTTLGVVVFLIVAARVGLGAINGLKGYVGGLNDIMNQN